MSKIQSMLDDHKWCGGGKHKFESREKELQGGKCDFKSGIL